MMAANLAFPSHLITVLYSKDFSFSWEAIFG